MTGSVAPTQTATGAPSSAPSAGEEAVVGEEGTVRCPKDAPPWVTKVFTQMSSEWIGGVFVEVLRSWVEVEQKHDFDFGNSKLGSTSRPGEVSEWIRDGREHARTVKNTKTFESKWWKWWGSLQPKWRALLVDAAPPPPPEGADWAVLDVPGQNGMLTVVATLYWWGCAEKRRGESARSEGWERAATDVAFVLKCLKAY
ncbi:hypothetical protein C8R47DRAFT_995805 [Mycena vitilis]|nr:hypothetical protein C8R47DRAFT_995805 [Mycena vitilis]